MAQLPFDSQNTRLIVMNLVPSMIAAIAMLAVALAYRKVAAKQTLLDFTPFAVVFAALVALLPLGSLTAAALPVGSLLQEALGTTATVYPALSAIIVIFVGAGAFASLAKTNLSVRAKIVWSGVAISTLLLAFYAISTTLSGLRGVLDVRLPAEAYVIESIVSIALVLAGWLVYWLLQVQALRKS